MPQQRPLLGFDSTIVAYDWGTAAGMSGAPIFEVAGGGYRAFGIVTGSVTVLGKPVEVGLRTNQKTIEFYRAAILSPSAAPADPPVRDAFTTTPGRSVTVRSTSSAAPDAPLVLQSSTDRVRWTTIATGATDHTGAGAFRIAPTHTQYYRFVARGVGPGPVSQGIVTGAASKTSFAAISGAAVASTARDAFAPWPSFVDGNASMVVFRGGSLDDLDAAIADAGGGAAWLQRADGGWCLYVVGAPAFVSDGVTQAFPAGLPGTTAVTVVPRGASFGSR